MMWAHQHKNKLLLTITLKTDMLSHYSASNSNTCMFFIAFKIEKLTSIHVAIHKYFMSSQINHFITIINNKY